MFCIDCGNNWIVWKTCIQCKPILTKQSFKSHNRRKHSCPNAKSLNSKKRSQKEISTDYDTCPDSTSLNSKKRSQKKIVTDYDTVSKGIYDFFHREDNQDILYYYHDISNNGLKYLMDRSRGLTGKSLWIENIWKIQQKIQIYVLDTQLYLTFIKRNKTIQTLGETGKNSFHYWKTMYGNE